MTRRIRLAPWLSRSATIVTLGAALTVTLDARADEVDACLAGADRGQALRRESHVVEAREQLRVCARQECPRVVRADCQRWLGEVDSTMPSIRIQVIDASGAPVGDARASIDGKPLALDGHALEIDPGEHVFHAEASEGRAADLRATVKSGERDRPIALALGPATAMPQSPTAATHVVPVGGWILGAVGVAALGAAAFSWVSGLGDRSTLYGGCGLTQSCQQSDVDASRTKLVVGDVFAAVGVVAAGAAVWITLSRWGHGSPPAAALSVVPGGALASWTRAF